jgi:hypothetical protein
MLKMKWTLSAALLAAAVAVTAPEAGAQSPTYKGTFTLPVEARFGNTVLQPGNYTVSTLGNASGIRITGEAKSVSILSAGYEMKPEAGKSKIVLVNTDNGYALRSFESEPMGRALHFVVAKSRGTSERASAKQTTIEIGMP